MSGRRSRSRSPRRRRRSSHSPDTSRRRSDGDGSWHSRRSEHRGRRRVASSSNQWEHDRYRSPGHHREKSSESKPVNVEPPMDSHTTTRLDKSTDQENHQEKGARLSKPERSGAKRLSPFVQREKNVLFPSGSNTVNRGRDRIRDRSWREERGRAERRGQEGRHSEGILSRESMEDNGGRGERRQLEAVVDPQEVPRAGYYFEHDDRDAPQSSQNRINSDSRRQERRYQHSPERWTRGRDSRDRSRDRSRASYRTWDRPSDSHRVRGWGRDPPRERLGRGNRSDQSDRRGGRDRSPVQWKHDLFETVNQPEQPEEPAQNETVPKWKSKALQDGIEDFNIDDVLLMDNPIMKMELDM